MPTPAESQLLAAYIDEGRTCTDRYVPEIAKVSPTVAQVLTQAYADMRATQLLVVSRQLNWGEAARRNQQTMDAAREKLRTQDV